MHDEHGEEVADDQPMVGVFTTQSKSVDQIVPALVAAQSEMQAVPTNAENNYYKRGTGQNAAPYRYADLAAVREACVPILAKHKIAVIQGTIPRAQMTSFERSDKGNHAQCMGDLCTQLLHVSGQWLAFKTPIVCDWGDVQKVAATTTYLRRSGLAAITGLAQQDDDGETARGRGQDARHDRRPDSRYDDRPQPQRQTKQPPMAGNGHPAGQTAAPAQQPAKRQSDGKSFYKWLTDHSVSFLDSSDGEPLDITKAAYEITESLGFGKDIASLNRDQSLKVYKALDAWIKNMTAPFDEADTEEVSVAGGIPRS